MFDLLSEPRISLNALASREGVHLSTVWRWCLRGVKGHKLESFAVGGKRFTTLPAFERWLAKINSAEVLSSQAPRQRESAVAKAVRDLDEMFGHKKRRDAKSGDVPDTAPPEA